MIELRAIGKDFPGVRALTDVSLAIAPGEVVGLVGENGAGKSTLIKILGGAYPAGSFRGEVVVDGTARAFRSARDARAAGIAVVHQELSLVPAMSVADNLLLGRERARWGVVDQAATEADARAIVRRVAGELADTLDLTAPVGALGVGVQQLLEIARALGDARDQAALIVLDEPTAALTGAEAERLFALVRERRTAGTSFIYISHRLGEIQSLSDRVAVMRDGQLVGIRETASTTEQEIVQMMTGDDNALDRARTRARARARDTSTCTTPGYELRSWTPGDRMRPARLKGRSRKLSDLYIDAKIPRTARRTARVLVRRADATIVWAEFIGLAHGESPELIPA